MDGGGFNDENHNVGTQILKSDSSPTVRKRPKTFFGPNLYIVVMTIDRSTFWHFVGPPHTPAISFCQPSGNNILHEYPVPSLTGYFLKVVS